MKPLPTLDGKIHRDARVAIESVHQSLAETQGQVQHVATVATNATPKHEHAQTVTRVQALEQQVASLIVQLDKLTP